MPAYNVAQNGNVAQVAPVSTGIQVGVPAGAVQRDSVPWPVQTLLNGTIRNQADIASLDQASIAAGMKTAHKNILTKIKKVI